MLKLFLLVCFSVNVMVDSIPLDPPEIQEHIIGGNDTDITKIPYQVAMYQNRWHYCGGFIVSPSFVVTAAHCVHDIKDSAVSIRAGSSSTKEGGVVVKAKKVYRHANFSMNTVDYDVAVIELDTPLQLNNKTMKAIKLVAKEPNAGSIGLVSGWGYINENLDNPTTLQSVNVPVYDRTKCASIYESYDSIITPRMLCAGGEGKGQYSGDSGGPLAYKGEVVGIVSFSVKMPKVPGVFVNIANPDITKYIKNIAKL